MIITSPLPLTLDYTTQFFFFSALANLLFKLYFPLAHIEIQFHFLTAHQLAFIKVTWNMLHERPSRHILKILTNSYQRI